MRVSLQKLDTLLARSGELLVARRRAASRQEDVVLFRDAVQRHRSEWRRLEKPLRKLLAPYRAQKRATTSQWLRAPMPICRRRSAIVRYAGRRDEHTRSPGAIAVSPAS